MLCARGIDQMKYKAQFKEYDIIATKQTTDEVLV